MFRRKRHSSHAAVKSDPSPSAQTAAVQAFRAAQSSSSNANLSSAAAAAALRKHPPSPTSVQDVQTKRTIQRRLSNSSAGSATSLPHGRGGGVNNRGRHDGSLRRSLSSGSMTARSLRDNNSLAEFGPAGHQSEVIPVPPIPDAYATNSSTHGRTASLQSPVRAISPPQSGTAARGPSLDRQSKQWWADSAEAAGTADPAELERNGSRGSINFSYPMNARPNSPRQRSSSEGYRLDNDSPYGSTPASSPPPTQPTKPDFRAAPDQRAQVAQSKTDPKGQRTSAVRASPHETYEQAGLRNGGTQGTPESDRDRHERGKVHHKFPDTQASKWTDAPQRQLARAPMETDVLRIPKKKPSTVRESVEEHDNHTLPTQDRHSMVEHDSGATVNEKIASAPSAKSHEGTVPKPVQTDHQHVPSATTPVPQKQPTTTASEQHKQQDGSRVSAPGTDHLQTASTSRSPSPARATRFSDHLEVANLHEPPPPSKTPAKPALKRSTSQSRSPDRAHGQSETSESTSITSDEAVTTKPKKKTAKVSFQDEPEKHGADTVSTRSSSTSPNSSGPQSSLPSHGGRTKEKSESDSFDDILKPRPTLPSFGSIRGRRRFVDDKPDVHPAKGEDDSHAVVRTAHSNDHALGSVLRNATPSKTPTSSQHDPDLPLPPVVTSVEGSGYEYSSEESSDSDDNSDAGSFIPTDGSIYSPPLLNRTAEENEGSYHMDEESVPQSTDDDQLQHPNEVPTIFIQPASPRFEEPDPNVGPSEIPGSFPSDRNGSATSSADTAQATTPNAQPEPSVAPSRSPVVVDDNSTKAQTATIPSSLAAADYSDSSSESGESVYSDAAEDLSDLEGDGFGSINAIVDSPVSKKQRKVAGGSTAGGPTGPRREVPAARAVNEMQIQPAQDAKLQSDSEARGLSPPSSTSGYPAANAQEISETLTHTVKHTRPGDRQKEEAVLANQPHRPGEVVSTSFYEPRAQQSYQSHERSFCVPDDRAVAGPSAHGAAPKETGVNGQGRGDSGQAEPPANRPLQRTLSNGSDSSSSFKRQRRSPRLAGHHTLRQTLRDGQRGLGAVSPSSEISTASQNQRRPFSSDAGHSGMRTTLRASAPPNEKSKKGSILSAAINPSKSKSFPTKNLFGGSNPKPEAKGRNRFRSRFEDSSDDEYEMVDFRPVRGIPRRRGVVDGDSTELEDSSDDEPQQRGATTKKNRSKAAGSSTVGAPALAAAFGDPQNAKGQTGGTQAPSNPAEFFREQRKQGTSLLSRLNPSKRKQRMEGVGIRKSDLESAARRDTPLERSRLELEKARVIPGNETTTNTTITAAHPKAKTPLSSKLQKRVSRFGSGSWPLQSNNNAGSADPSSAPKASQQPPSTPPRSKDNEERPHTSDGIVPSGNTNKASDSPRSRRFLPKLQMHSRHNTADTAIPRSPLSDSGRERWNVSTGTQALKGGEKRAAKFPMLKKALGIKR